uniref:Uncharacterized protein n=1 Tax=Quercus lobata TaxID=97700 RepID=A0A7N2LTD7_QUELO
MTVSGWVYMISVGFNAAASVRVSNELGAGHPKSAAFSVVIVTLSSAVIAVICAILVLALRHVISYVFTSGSTVADAVSELSPFLAISIILNGIQPVLSVFGKEGGKHKPRKHTSHNPENTSNPAKRSSDERPTSGARRSTIAIDRRARSTNDRDRSTSAIDERSRSSIDDCDRRTRSSIALVDRRGTSALVDRDRRSTRDERARLCSSIAIVARSTIAIVARSTIAIVHRAARRRGVAVGCGWQAFVAYVNVGCYYIIGIPLGAVLGFKFDLGAKGIWSGMIGGTFIQTLILIWFTFRTDWTKEVEKAKLRLDKWEDKKESLLTD